MPYYHVIISLKDRKKDILDENLLEQELLDIIVKPLRNHEKFRCGNDIINLEDISNIQITTSQNRLQFMETFSSEAKLYATHWQTINQQKDVTSKYIKPQDIRPKTRKKPKSKKALMNQEKLNNIIKKWLESKGFNAKITGKEHKFTVQVQDLFPIKGYCIPDVIGIKNSHVVIVETENKLDEIYEAIVKCLIWKVMATFVYIAYPKSECKKFRVLEKYGIGLLSVSENKVKEVVSLMEDGKPKFRVTELHPLDFAREQEVAKQIKRALSSNE